MGRRNLARATGLQEGSAGFDLPPCPFIDTPWKTRLNNTKGSIMVSSELHRLSDRVVELREKGCNDLVIEGQHGTGKTYLAYYILIKCLSRRRNVFVYSNESVVLFSAKGVYSGFHFKLNLFALDDFETAVGGEAWAIVDIVGDDDFYGPSADVMYPVRIFPATSRPLERYVDDNLPAVMVLDSPTVQSVLLIATLHHDMKPTEAHLRRLLGNIHMFGPKFGACLASDTPASQAALVDYISAMAPSQLSKMAKQSRFELCFAGIARSGGGPDILSLRCDIADHEGFLPTIASRFVLSEIARLHGYAGLSSLCSMDVVKRQPDGLRESRRWLHEFLIHYLLSDGSPESLRLFDLKQVFPFDASKRRGALKVAHLSLHREVEVLETGYPASFNCSAYHVVGNLSDPTYHAVVHAQLGTSSKSISPVVISTATVDQRQKLRPRANGVYTTTRGKRTSVKRKRQTDRRLVVFLQVVAASIPELTMDGLARLERAMESDTDAEYFFVFVTGKTEVLDLSTIPQPWANRLRWYQLAVDINLDADGDPLL
ncbi:hypothetical protein PENSPDRAFT_656301 [Peniophora sp. CONT]|nr:hypothetical protein PENSPDRAFT_656301 [Peniophora sp. CONT]